VKPSTPERFFQFRRQEEGEVRFKALLTLIVSTVAFPVGLTLLTEPTQAQFPFNGPCGGPPIGIGGVLPGGLSTRDPACREIHGIDGKCLDAAGGSSANGTRIILWPCHGGANQRWKVMASGLVIGIGGKCLDALGGNSANGTPVILWSCHRGDNQLWEITNNRELLGIGNKCLDVSGGGSANGSPIILWTCHGGPNQRWDARYAP
jgi:hypothetical protein